MTELIQINKLRDYSACPNFAKYNWLIPENSSKKNTIRSVVESCYRDIAILNKKVEWKTIRNRIHKTLAELEPNLDNDSFYSSSIAIMEALRTWYVDVYRNSDEEGIAKIKLDSELYEYKIEAIIDMILIEKKNKEITIIEFTEKEKIEDILRDIGLRTKIWLLGKQNIKVSKVVAIKCSKRTIRYCHLTVNNADNWNFKTEQALQLMMLSFKNKIFYPSPTAMCDTCKFKDICSW